MGAITALIIDDEQLDRELLTNLIRDYCTSIVVHGEASTVKAGVLDYMLKPLDVDELLETEQKLIKVIYPQKAFAEEQLFQVYDKGRHVMIDTNDIVCQTEKW